MATVTRTGLAIGAAAVLVGGITTGWIVAIEFPGARDRSLTFDADPQTVALQAAMTEQSVTIARLEAELRENNPARMRADLEQLSSRISRIEERAASLDARRVAKAVNDLQSVVRGGQTLLIEDRLAVLVRTGDPAVPEIVALLLTGVDQEYGGRLQLRGNAVASYPNLRLVLFDALRQIGTADARSGLLKALAASSRLTDFEVVSLFWQRGMASPDAALSAAFSTTASSALRDIASRGLDTAADAPDSPIFTVFRWVTEHPAPADIPSVERIVLAGRPTSVWGGRAFESAFRALIQLAPERAAQATQTLHLSASDTVNLSGYLPGLSRSSQVQYYEALLARSDMTARVRADLYARMPTIDDRIKDRAERENDVQPIVRLLESRVESETDVHAKDSAEQALLRLRTQVSNVR